MILSWGWKIEIFCPETSSWNLENEVGAALGLKYVHYKMNNEDRKYTQDCEDEFVSECVSRGCVSDFVSVLKRCTIRCQLSLIHYVVDSVLAVFDLNQKSKIKFNIPRTFCENHEYFNLIKATRYLA